MKIFSYPNAIVTEFIFKPLVRSQIVHETIKVKEATNRSIEVEARLASKKLATYLEVAKNAPILQTTIIEKNAENNPLYCGVNSFDATEFKYTSE